MLGDLASALFGEILTLLGDVRGAMIAFQLARYRGRRWLLKRLGPRSTVHIGRLPAGLTPRMLVVTRLLHVFSFEWASCTAGLTRMRASTFVVVTTVRRVIGITVRLCQPRDSRWAPPHHSGLELAWHHLDDVSADGRAGTSNAKSRLLRDPRGYDRRNYWPGAAADSCSS